jgi:molybdopterin molybdotransferase
MAMPHERNAAMDGYAFCSQAITTDRAFTLDLVGTSWAGKPFTPALQAGQCVRIFTGAVVPEKADSVVMQEHVKAESLRIHFPAQTKIQQNIREVGEDVQTGDLLFTAAKKFTAFDLSLLASVGIAQVTVKRPLRLAFFSTGDELTALGQMLASGNIYDSNRYLLQGLLADTSYHVVDGGILADDKQLLHDTLVQTAATVDAIITTGGASVGEADYVHEVLAACGDVAFWKIAMKPGKPLAFGKIGACYFFGLPGNPVAVAATLQQLVAPALRQLSGASAVKPLRLLATCTTALKKARGRQDFQRGILTQDATGEFFVASSGTQGSHVLSTLAHSDCYIVLPAECSGVEVGEKVTIEPFSLFI